MSRHTILTGVVAAGALAVSPGAVMAISAPAASPNLEESTEGSCEHCGMATPLEKGETELMVTTIREDGHRISVWLSKRDNRVHGRCFAADGRPLGAEFRIDTAAKDGLLPVIIPRAQGFTAGWQQDGARLEQRFDSDCRPVSAQGAPLRLRGGKGGAPLEGAMADPPHEDAD